MTEDKQKITDNGTLTTKQARAIACLLSTRTAREAARMAKVGEKTLYTWLADPAFRGALREAEKSVLDDVTRRLSAGQSLALDTLESLIAKAKHESTRRQAANDWLNFSLKYRDMQDIDERLTALEAAIHDNK